MASIFKSVEVTAGLKRYCASGVYALYGHYTLAGSALVINDVIQMVNIPAGARVLAVDLYVDRLDTGATPTITLDVGDGVTTNLYITLAVVGQSAVGQVTSKTATYGQASAFAVSPYTSDDTIDILVHTAPQTGLTNSTVKLVALVSNDI